VRFKIGQLMIVVAVAALVLTPFAWSPPESRGPLFASGLTVVTMLLILSSPFLIDRLAGGRAGLRPRTKRTKPLPRLLRLFLWPDPPHKREPPRPSTTRTGETTVRPEFEVGTFRSDEIRGRSEEILYDSECLPMAVSLGPIPESLRLIVRRWIEDGRRGGGGIEIEGAIDALFITGGPVGCSYLDGDGELWEWHVGDDSFTRIEDGPLKVGTIAVAADHLPELAEWLPRRPREAVECSQCAGGGWLLPPWPRVLCPRCVGLGWRLPEIDA
jgi:hypothetical protein